jgi:hypothetical protein
MYREFFKFSSGSEASGAEESDLEELYHEIEVGKVHHLHIFFICFGTWMSKSNFFFFYFRRKPTICLQRTTNLAVNQKMKIK